MIIKNIAKDAVIAKTTGKIAFESSFEGIKSGIKIRNSKVTLVGFGNFKEGLSKNPDGPQSSNGRTNQSPQRHHFQSKQNPRLNIHTFLKLGWIMKLVHLTFPLNYPFRICNDLSLNDICENGKIPQETVGFIFVG